MLPMKSTDPDGTKSESLESGGATQLNTHIFFEILVERVGCPQKLVGIF